MPVILMLGSLLLSCVFSCKFKELCQALMYERDSVLGTKIFASLQVLDCITILSKTLRKATRLAFVSGHAVCA